MVKLTQALYYWLFTDDPKLVLYKFLQVQSSQKFITLISLYTLLYTTNHLLESLPLSNYGFQTYVNHNTHLFTMEGGGGVLSLPEVKGVLVNFMGVGGKMRPSQLTLA